MDQYTLEYISEFVDVFFCDMRTREQNTGVDETIFHPDPQPLSRKNRQSKCSYRSLLLTKSGVVGIGCVIVLLFDMIDLWRSTKKDIIVLCERNDSESSNLIVAARE